MRTSSKAASTDEVHRVDCSSEKSDAAPRRQEQWLVFGGGGVDSGLRVHCPKSNPNFRDKT